MPWNWFRFVFDSLHVKLVNGYGILPVLYPCRPFPRLIFFRVETTELDMERFKPLTPLHIFLLMFIACSKISQTLFLLPSRQILPFHISDFNPVRYPNHKLPPWALFSKTTSAPALPPNATPSTM